eukprot:3007028-Pleurochrysis_carterae.AAC.4
MQASDRRCALSRCSRRVTLTHRTLIAFALLMSEAALATTAAPLAVYPSSLHQPPPSVQWPARCKSPPHSSAFALAADLLESTVCVASRNRQLLAALWALARAITFWMLHLGYLSLPGRSISH